MAYERVAITDTPTPSPASAIPTMREERVVEYKSQRHAPIAPPSAPPPTPSGQPNINSEAETAEGLAKPAESVTLSPQMAALARREQRFRANEQAFKAKEAALEAERKEIEDLRALKAKLAAKDYSGLENLVPYDDYTNYLIEKTEAQSPEQQAIRALQEKVAGVETRFQETVSKQFEAAVNERKRVVSELVESKPEFAVIKKLKATDAVVQHILDTWEHDNVDLSPEDAAKEVAKELLDRADRWKSVLEEPNATSPADTMKELPPLKSGIKTLTNNMAATGEIKRAVKPLYAMSESERYAEARRRAEEKLKQQVR